MAAAAIKVASAAQGHTNNARKKNPNYVAPDDNDEGKDKVEKAVPDTMEYATEGFFKYQRQAREFYTDQRIEIFVAFLIAANFITNIFEKQIDPTYGARGIDGEGGVDKRWCKQEGNTVSGYCVRMNQREKVWWGFALFYNIAFTMELLINMYGLRLGMAFWKSGWNIFDLVVVAIGVIGYIIPPSVLGPFALLRMMRAFRVFRLFKRVKSLNKILVSLARAIPGVCNAFLIMLIVMCIYAILGVEFYKYEGTRCAKEAASRNISYKQMGLSYDGDDCYLRDGDDLSTTFGYVYFGNFMKSLYSLFQVLTGDSWSEAIGRPLMDMHWYSTLYFVSFILLNGIVLINVVVAVLLEKMVDETPEAPEDEFGDEDEILSTEERLEKLEETSAHIQLMLTKLLEAQHIALPPVKPSKLSAAPTGALATAPAHPDPDQEQVLTLKGSEGGPSRVDYTEPKDSGLLHDDDVSVQSVSSPAYGGDESAEPGCSLPGLGCA